MRIEIKSKAAVDNPFNIQHLFLSMIDDAGDVVSEIHGEPVLELKEPVLMVKAYTGTDVDDPRNQDSSTTNFFVGDATSIEAKWSLLLRDAAAITRANIEYELLSLSS
jgi:hypothetical protein